MKSRALYTVLLTARPNFLILSLSVVLLGTAVAMYEGAEWSWGLFGLITIAAILAHSAVNMLNEYQDYHSGLDLITPKTPFSGGSGALVADPESASVVKVAFIVVMLALVVVGAYLINHSGWLLGIFGGLGLALIIFYTRFITRMPWLCLIAPGLAFGPIMVIGTYFVWSGTVSELVVVLSIVPFFLVNNLLLLNQIPDLKADKQIGRYNILMRLGLENGLQIFAAFNIFAFVVIALAIWLYQLPSLVWLGYLSLLIVFPMMNKIQTTYQELDKLMPVLAMNVVVNLVTPVLIATGLWASLRRHLTTD